MFWESLKKVPDKINERIVNLKVPPVIPIENHAHRKVILATICLLTIVVFSAVITNFALSKTIVYASSVNGLGTGIYWDQALTNRTLSLNWGPIAAGSNNTLTIYIKNESNSAASLSLGTSNWTPSAALDYMSLNWNYSGQVLSVGQVIPVELTLTVSPTISGVTNFSFDTIITTSEG